MIRLPTFTPSGAVSLVGMLLFFTCVTADIFVHQARQREYDALVRDRLALSAQHAAATRAADPAAPAIQAHYYAVVTRHTSALLRYSRCSVILSELALVGLIVRFSDVPGWAAWFRRKQRKRAGRCQTCGYDLTGNVSGVCPECGTKRA